MRLVRLKPPHIAFLLCGAGAGLHFAVPAPYRAGPHCLTCGIAVAALGLAVMIWSWWLFRRAGTPIRPWDRATRLVMGGPFRFSRNPMYAGVTAILLGIALVVGSWPMLVAPAGFVLIMSLVTIPYEEKRLRDAFGDEYEAYVARVRRWI